MHVWDYLRIVLEGDYIFEHSPLPLGLKPRMTVDDALLKLGSAGWEIATCIQSKNVNTLILKRPRS